MVDILEFIDELKELQVLYQTGDLRDFDLQTKIQKYENQVGCIIDGGMGEIEPSTIIDCYSEERPRIIRLGAGNISL